MGEVIQDIKEMVHSLCEQLPNYSIQKIEQSEVLLPWKIMI